MASLLNIGQSGLNAAQAALTTTGHNISNANTEGYSRQDVILASSSPEFAGSGNYLGTGVSVESIRRIVDESLINQLRLDTTMYNQVDVYNDKINSLDKLLGSESTGLQSTLSSFFEGMQSSANDPTSIPNRNIVLTRANDVVDRMHLIDNNIEDQYRIANEQLTVMADTVSKLAENIAALNVAISAAGGQNNGYGPNDLFDQRDESIRQLAELVDVRIVQQDHSIQDVYIGNGQALVINGNASKLEAVAGEKDPTKLELQFTGRTVSQNVTSMLSGGQIGGLLQFRDEELGQASLILGQISVAFTDQINEQLALGLDLKNDWGKNLFTDINDRDATLARVTAYTGNSTEDNVLSLSITDSTAIPQSNYIVEMVSPDPKTFTVVRESDGMLMAEGTLAQGQPTIVEFDGLQVSLEQGSFEVGDKFYLQPTAGWAGRSEVILTEPEELAFSSPIRTESNTANRGNAQITQGIVSDVTTDSFSLDKQLNPPLVVVFTSETTYDVLDNSDPANPVDLRPPLRGLTYTPGVINEILPEDTGQTMVTTNGPDLPAAPTPVPVPPAAVTLPGNGFDETDISILESDPITGLPVVTDTINIPANTSAYQIARELTDVHGIQAHAFTKLEATNFVKGGGLTQEIYLNGTRLTDPGNLALTSYTTIPDPVDPDFLAEMINSLTTFTLNGITASSDGETLSVYSDQGDDLSLVYSGDATSGVEVGTGEEFRTEPTGTDTRGLLNSADGFDFSINGPYTYEFYDKDGSLKSFELTGDHATNADVIQEIETAVAQASPGPWTVKAEIDARGNINFERYMPLNGLGTMQDNAITIGGTVDIVLEEGLSLSTVNGGNILPQEPVALPNYFGYQVEITGSPLDGDKFVVDFNLDGFSDNRNVLALAGLETKDLVNGGKTSFSETYNVLVTEIGSKAYQSGLNFEASKSLLEQSTAARDSVSGVNLDEEAANLIRFEQAYNASAKLIQVASEVIDTLLNTF